MKSKLKYLFDHTLGLKTRRNILWAPVFGVVYYTIFAHAADFVSELLAPQLVSFELDEQIRKNIMTSIALTVFYLVFGLILIYVRRVHLRFSAWVFLLLAVGCAFFRFTHVLAATFLAFITMLRGLNPLTGDLHERAIHGEEVPTRASRPPPEVRASKTAMQRHRSHNVAAEEPLAPKRNDNS